MTPTRALFGVAAVAVAGYVVIHSVSDEGPQYLGDFPSILEQAEAEPDVDAQPVVPDTPTAPPAGPAGPGPVPPAAPPGGGGSGGQGGYPQPGVPGPPNLPLPSFTDFLSGLPPIDAAQVCRDTAGSIIALVPCDRIPELPPVDPPDLADLPVG